MRWARRRIAPLVSAGRRMLATAAARIAGPGVLRDVLERTTVSGLAPEEFDAAFYVRHYPDVLAGGFEPREHYVRHGRPEDRYGRMPAFPLAGGGLQFDASRESVLVICHDASMTGAPMVGLNVAQGLAQTYNVVAFLLRGGPLADSFAETSVLVGGPLKDPEHHALIGDAITRLLDRHAFKFAIINSIECVGALEPLARRSIPTITLVHEFASYTQPKSAFRHAFFWSDQVVFSTRIAYDDAITQYPELANRAWQLLPQGRCRVNLARRDARTVKRDRARLRDALRPAGQPSETLLVVGVGSVHLRKGIDLFLDCAARAVREEPDRPFRFAWIGRGYNPQPDLSYSSFLADQVRRSGLEGRVHFIDDTPEIELAYELADVFVLSSRLDPLPNVAIDAMSHGLPVLCFAGTTGVADILAANGLADACVAPYLDTPAMAARLVGLANDPSLRQRIGARLKGIAAAEFDMSRYVARIDALATEATAAIAAEQAQAQELAASDLCRPDYLVPSRSHDLTADDLRWAYLRPWRTGVGAARKLSPGFHPGIYRERAGSTGASSGDPLLDYLRAGQPDGPWRHELLTEAQQVLPVPAALRVALQLHVYYPDLLPEIVEGLARNALRPDLFVSVTTEDAAVQVRAALRGVADVVHVEVVPNRGRDIAPLLTQFASRLAVYDIVGHLHAKKSVIVADASIGERWRRFLLGNLLSGAGGMMDRIVGRMAQDPSIGLVFPDDPYLVNWTANRAGAQSLGRRLGIAGDLPRHFVFPVGTMFWARVDAIRPLLALGLDWPDYPVEPLPYDGSMLHALERLLPFVAERQGFRCVLTSVSGVSR
jgi:glycosyltransferase involved in cell wall biosynthesis